MSSVPLEDVDSFSFDLPEVSVWSGVGACNPSIVSPSGENLTVHVHVSDTTLVRSFDSDATSFSTYGADVSYLESVVSLAKIFSLHISNRIETHDDVQADKFHSEIDYALAPATKKSKWCVVNYEIEVCPGDSNTAVLQCGYVEESETVRMYDAHDGVSYGEISSNVLDKCSNHIHDEDP